MLLKHSCKPELSPDIHGTSVYLAVFAMPCSMYCMPVQVIYTHYRNHSNQSVTLLTLIVERSSWQTSEQRLLMSCVAVAAKQYLHAMMLSLMPDQVAACCVQFLYNCCCIPREPPGTMLQKYHTSAVACRGCKYAPLCKQSVSSHDACACLAVWFIGTVLNYFYSTSC
jgi:hypothetical protein